MNNSMEPIGIYIHIPFCLSKCIYCDFYSVPAEEELLDAYVQAVYRDLDRLSDRIRRPVDTVYFGGGTPSVMGERIADILGYTAKLFPLQKPEITMEANPGDLASEIFQQAAAKGLNRISFGLQSANNRLLTMLGRRHSREDAAVSAEAARSAGIENISFDLMLGLPHQTTEDIRQSVDFCIAYGVCHVSAYILKVEEGTPLFHMQASLPFPSEEEVCQQYLYACEYLESKGFMQYEISNFARKGQVSRHNLKYWDGREYLGIGPGAHSFLNGRHFYYRSDLRAFLGSTEPIDDGAGGDFSEYAMLRLRLTEGLREEDVESRFHMPIPEDMYNKAEKYRSAGYLIRDESGIRLTRRGFLISNNIIGDLIL